jgi:hypothetical protein
MSRHSKNGNETSAPQPDRALLLQRTAHQWQELAEKQAAVMAMLRAIGVQQRELVDWWEAMDPAAKGATAHAVEDNIHDLFLQTLELVRKALAQESACIQEAKRVLPHASSGARAGTA